MNTCEMCGNQFKPRQATKPNRFCSRACYYAAPRTPKEGVKNRMKRAAGHPLAPASGVVAVARLNLYAKIGEGSHACHWCGEMLEWKVGTGIGPRSGMIIADHLDWDTTNDAAENLVVSCTQCNAHRTRKGDRRRITEAEPFITLSNGLRTRAAERECEWCGRPFLTLPAYVKKGKGRFCSYDCGRNGMRSRKNW